MIQFPAKHIVGNTVHNRNAIDLSCTSLTRLVFYLQITLRVMAKLVCISQPQLDYMRRKFRDDPFSEGDKKCPDKSDHCCNGVCSTMSLVNTEQSAFYENSNAPFTPGPPQGVSEQTTVELQVAEIRRTMQRIELRLEERQSRQARDASISGEWKAVGTVLDRFFFVIYIVLIIASIFIFFPRPN